MTWGPESPERLDLFEAKLLPSSQALRPEDSSLLGVGVAAPTENARGEGAGLADTTAATGKAAWRRRLSPRHRRAVGAFFRRDE
jgi:hypothetical protein